MEDGAASKRVIDFFINNKQENIYNYDKKKANLCYIGNFEPENLNKEYLFPVLKDDSYDFNVSQKQILKDSWLVSWKRS